MSEWRHRLVVRTFDIMLLSFYIGALIKSEQNNHLGFAILLFAVAVVAFRFYQVVKDAKVVEDIMDKKCRYIRYLESNTGHWKEK